MTDHDQRFKALLEEFFAEFFRLFLPEWAGRFDFNSLEWLREEVFTDPPEGERRLLDLVARLATLQPLSSRALGQTTSSIALLHMEVESAESVAQLRPRMFDYFRVLEQRHHLPVLPIALYLRVGLDGIGWDVYDEWFWEHRLVHFEYAYVGLPALDAETYLNGENVLGVALAALMRVPEEKRAWLKAEALRRLVTAPENPHRRFLLCECVQAYLPLEGPQLTEFNEMLLSERYCEVRPMATTWFEDGLAKGMEQGLEKGLVQGLEKGLEKGRQEGQLHALRLLVSRQLEKRFGPLPPETRVRLESWPTERLEEVGEKLLDARSLDELGLGPDRIA
jgi:hypothetical protein